MSSQGSLIRPGFANREEVVPVQAKLLARRDDAATSKRAAKRVVESGRLSFNQRGCLEMVRRCGPGTAKQIVLRWKASKPTQVYHELCRRLPELERKGLVRVQQDPSKPCRCKRGAKRCRCRDVIREGSRSWEVVA